MRRFGAIVIGSILILIIGAIVLIPFNDWYWHYKGYEGGYDDEMRMFKFLLFFEWPILILLGGLIGDLVFKKYLAINNSNE